VEHSATGRIAPVEESLRVRRCCKGADEAAVIVVVQPFERI
jgi:hypothetical protein